MKNSAILPKLIPVILLLAMGPLTHVQANDLEKLYNYYKSSKSSSTGSQLSQDDISAGLKEALRVGSDTVVKKLGKKDGFNKDKSVYIPLPKDLNKVKKTLSKIGYGDKFEDLELNLNRSAEKATPKAKALFVDAIKQMKWEDVKHIYNGPDDSATRYFQGKMTPQLKNEFRPIISETLAETGVIKSYEKIMKKYDRIPFMPDVKADLTEYTIDKTLYGIFHYLAKEEAAIRKDPVKRTTDILKKVFG